VIFASSRREYAHALEVGFEALRLLGVDLPGDPDRWEPAVTAAVARIQGRLAGTEIEALLERPELTDPRLVATTGLLADLNVAAANLDLRAAALLGGAEPSDPGPDALPGVLVRLMRDLEVPGGVAALGYRQGDVPELVEGAMQQQRLLAVAPRQVTEEALAAIFLASLQNW
jgi:hypothetical protein